ncbi:MAG TPA: peptidoglycan bridge formation glycyltransferase FemA/FemB family protein [Rubrobacteraceae bacterium]|nr:peptidoglycan bridge formation glycyltransferase FemA/FemB family protein [Rubrobacteraceae bacterium]
MSPTEQNTSRSNTTGRYTAVEKEGVATSQWNQWVESSPGGGHLLQSHEWGEFKRKLGWKPVRMTLERDRSVVGAGQFLFYSTPVVPGGMLYCPKGPWLAWDDEEAVRAFFDGVVEVARHHNAHTVKIEPEVQEQQEEVKHLRALGFQKFRWNVNHKATLVIDLTWPEEDLLANMKKSTRYGVRRAAKEGVEVVEDNSRAALDQFWRMHGEMVERKDFWSRPYSYYEALWRALEKADRAHLFFAEHEGDRPAAAMVFTFGHKCIYMLGVSTREKSKITPANLLQWEIMKWARENGITYYDMWGVPTLDKLDENHPLYGVYKFKAGFGSELVDFVGTLDLPVKSAQAKLWDKVEPWYFRFHQRVKGDVYY